MEKYISILPGKINFVHLSCPEGFTHSLLENNFPQETKIIGEKLGYVVFALRVC
jgi:hypothetical protein